MVQIIEENPDFAQLLGRSAREGLNKGFATGSEYAMKRLSEEATEKRKLQQLKGEDAAIKKQLGIDLTGIIDPKQRQEYLMQALQGRRDEQKGMSDFNRQSQLQNEKYGLRSKELDYKNNLREQLLSKISGGSGGGNDDPQFQDVIPQIEQKLGFKLTPEQIQSVQQATMGSGSEDPYAQAEQYAAIGEHDLSNVASKRADTAIKQTNLAKKETLPIRKEFADKAKYARQGIENKKALLALLKQGNVDDPWVVEASKYLPGAVGSKLLSDETHLYRGGLFEEFGVLRSMFPGTTRVKEIELLEDKLATLDKNHSAKAKILENGMMKLKRDIILADSARKVEKLFPNASILDFEGLVSEAAQPELDKLYEDIVDGYDKIYLEFAPSKSTYIDQNGDEYRDVPKKDLNKFFEEAKSMGIDLKVSK